MSIWVYFFDEFNPQFIFWLRLEVYYYSIFSNTTKVHFNTDIHLKSGAELICLNKWNPLGSKMYASIRYVFCILYVCGFGDSFIGLNHGGLNSSKKSVQLDISFDDKISLLCETAKA